MNLFTYWEKSSQSCGKVPALIKLCRETVVKYCEDDFNIKFLNPRKVKRLIHLPEGTWQMRNIAMRTDIIRARILKKFGGLWLDSDLIVLDSLKEVKEKLKENEFVGYKKTSHGDNHIPNNFFACKAECESITGYVKTQNKILYNKNQIGWSELGAKALTPNVKNAYLFEEKRIQPIPWQEQEKFYKEGEADLPEDALCCVYFNNAQAVREKITDLRFLMNAEEVLNKDIMLVAIIKQALNE